MSNLSYTQRANHSLNPTMKKLFCLMDEKESNLSVAVDVTKAADLLRIADEVGPEICLLKTHIDIIEDFTPDLPHKLAAIAAKHRFQIFEDRKFADIGNTSKLQYEGGIYKIIEWADIINAHIVPGPGIIEGLASHGLQRGRGLLLLAQMSPKGSLSYPKKALAFAKRHPEFVIGFISREKISDDPAHCHMTPGVSEKEGKDPFGQQYLTPEVVIGKLQSDLIIVGRSIIHAAKPQEAAKLFRLRGWNAYKNRLTK